jgi:hypothetical protein
MFLLCFLRRNIASKIDCLQKELKSKDLSVIAVPSDGFCFFKAVAVALNLGKLEEQDVLELKNGIRDEIITNLPLYKSFCEDTVNILVDLDRYLNAGDYNSSIGDLCIAAFCNWKHVKLVIYDVRNSTEVREIQHPPKDDKFEKVIYLRRSSLGTNVCEHYDALIPIVDHRNKFVNQVPKIENDSTKTKRKLCQINLSDMFAKKSRSETANTMSKKNDSKPIEVSCVKTNEILLSSETNKDEVSEQNNDSCLINISCGKKCSDLSKSPGELPMQPQLSIFPKTNGRRFSAKYYETYCWLEYSVTSDSVFCFACRHFSSNLVRQGEILGNIAFVDNGIRKWRDINTLLSQHECSQKHKNSIIAWSNFKNIISEKQSSVASALDTSRAAAVQENRQHIKLLFKAAIYLAKQGLAFRGDDETNDSLNKGNYIELLQNITYENPASQEKLQRRYGHYTSPEIQNDIIGIIAESVRKQILHNIGPYWTLMVDETRDASRKEQLSFAIRSTHSSQFGKIFEKVLGISYERT